MGQKTEQIMREDTRAWNDNRERIPVASEQVATVANAPSPEEKWREIRPSKKIVFGLLVAAIALTMVVGFKWGGWVTDGAAQQQAATGAKAAVVLRLAPICVAQFNLDPQKATKLDELKAITNSRERTTYVTTQGWATMPGETAPDGNVANACTTLLIGS